MATLEAVIHAAKKLHIETWMLRTLEMPPGAWSTVAFRTFKDWSKVQSKRFQSQLKRLCCKDQLHIRNVSRQAWRPCLCRTTTYRALRHRTSPAPEAANTCPMWRSYGPVCTIQAPNSARREARDQARGKLSVVHRGFSRLELCR